MSRKKGFLRNLLSGHEVGFRIVILAVAVNGLILIAGTLDSELFEHAHRHLRDALFSIPLLSGVTLLYLSSLLARRKRTAWMVGIPIYCFILGLSTMQLLIIEPEHHTGLGIIVRNIVLPVIVIAGLIYYRRKFIVRSDIEGFRQALGFIVIVLGVTFFYGVAGYMLMDKADFHKEIGFWEAAHRTIDQFGLTTSTQLVPYTRRAKLFTDSLSIISIGSLVYAAVALFQPIRARFGHQAAGRERMRLLIESHSGSSEDFFKLWPHDKNYFFEAAGQAGLAFHVRHGIALVAGDPSGNPEYFKNLLEQFGQFCYGNDWRPAFIHTEPKFNKLYESFNYDLQKIGEEAVLNLEHFKTNVAHNKYFRHIRNKFEKLGYTAEVLMPPHSPEVINRLNQISRQWLSAPGRVERGYMMGYFSAEYMNLCPVFVLRNGDGEIQAFLNQVLSYDSEEANFDLFRQASDSPGNIIDFLIMNFVDYLDEQGFKRLNLGLCPLSGLDKKTESIPIINNSLRFAYANGDRIYSFSGLKRFKEKYEPEWHDRYVVYRGGIRGFIRTVNSLDKAMKVKHHVPEALRHLSLHHE